MRLRQDTREAISKLARLAVAMQTNSQFDRETMAGMAANEFYELHWTLYYQSRNILLVDPALDNRSYKEIQDELWALLDELVIDREQYANRKAINSRLNNFWEHLTRESAEFEAMFEIEGISLPDGQIKIGKTTFLHLTRESALSFDLPIDRPLPLSKDLVGKTIGITRVKAGSFDRAFEIASEEVDTSLNMLRFAMASTYKAPQVDEFFLQRRGLIHVIKKIGTRPEFQSGIGKAFRIIELDLRKSLSGYQEPLGEAARKMGEMAAALYDGSIPSPLSQSMLRALEWAGSSVTRESFDDRIVDLCTAMECMLTVGSDKLKGERIAARYILLCSLTTHNFVEPHAPLPIYRIRSKIIHGAERRIAGRTHNMKMRAVVMNTFSMALDLVTTHKEIRTITNLIDFLESKKSAIDQTLLILNEKYSKDDRDVMNYVNGLLQKLPPGQRAVNELFIKRNCSGTDMQE